MKNLAVWLLLPTLIMGTWIGPTTSADTGTDASQVVSVAAAPSNLAQIEATPVHAEPETSDPAVTDPATDTGSTSVAPADFPNVCDKSAPVPTSYPVGFTVQYPAGFEDSSLQVRIFAENNGCIPGHGYQVTLDFASGETNKEPLLPAGSYFYEYDGKGFEPGRYVYFQVVDGGPDEAITITPAPVPAAYEVSVNVTLPAGGSSMTIVISDANGTIDSRTVSVSEQWLLELPEGEYFYEYWGDDYPWSDRQQFKVAAETPTTITISPTIAAITLTPSQAPAGTDVDVHVTGFRANDEYDISFSGVVVSQGNRADDTGEISATITIPNGLAPGKYPVVVTGAVSGQRVEATFTVGEVAQVNVNPTSGPAGVVITVSGSGYAPGERVDILFGGDTGSRVGYVIAKPDGTFAGRISIPSSAAMESHTIIATQKSGSRATTTYTVTERVINVDVTPSSVKPGAVVTMTGSGFGPSKVVNIYWGSDSGPRLGYRTTDSSGKFTGRVTVPKTATVGDYLIVAREQDSGPTGSATISVTVPQVTVSPTSQTSGKVVSVAGSGFGSGEIVDIRWDGPNGRLVGYRTTSSSGSVSGAVTVPAGTVPGDYSIVLIGRTSGWSGSATLTVTGATVTVSPAQASPGTVVAVRGSGFGSGEVVDIRWNGPSGNLLGYRSTTTEGSMSGKVTIPANAQPGTFTLFLQGRDSGIVGSVTVVIPAASSLYDLAISWRTAVDSEGMVRTSETRSAS